MEGLRKVTFGLLIIMVMVILGYFLLPMVLGSKDPAPAEVLSNQAVQPEGPATSAVSVPVGSNAAATSSTPSTSVSAPTATATTVDPANRAQRRVDPGSAPTTTTTTTPTTQAIGQATTSTSTRYFVTTSTPVSVASPATVATTPVAATAPTSTTTTTAPQTQPLPRQLVEAQLAEVLVRETFPILVDVRIVGRLPSDCHRPTIVGPRHLPDSRISMDVTTETTRRTDCGQDNVDFSRVVSIGELDPGSYILELNGTQFAFTV